MHTMEVESKQFDKNNRFMRFIIASRHVHSSIQRLAGLGHIWSYKTSSKNVCTIQKKKKKKKKKKHVT